jgi:hypothetical protein
VKLLHSAFTFFEIMVVLILIGVVTTIFAPRLIRRPLKTEWHTITDDFNTMALFARQEAIIHKKVYRLAFKSNPNAQDLVWIEEENDDPEKPKRKIYTAISSYYFNTRYQLADQVKLKAVRSGKRDLLSDEHGVAYCSIKQDGLIDDITVQLVRKIDSIETAATLKMNPFLGRFELQEGE